MKCFFDRKDTKWRSLNGAIHVYIAIEPRNDLAQDLTNFSRGICGDKKIAIQPLRFLHMTVQRLDLYADELSEYQFEGFINNLRRKTKSIKPFTVDCEKPKVRLEAIEAVGENCKQWEDLVAAIREGVVESGLGNALTEPPFAPHFTLAYCIEDTSPEEDEYIESLLKHFRGEKVKVNGVDLVAVTQDREAGVFEFETLERLSFYV